MKLRKNDLVKVIAGRDKGKSGRILEIDRENERIVVEGVMLVKRHTKANPSKQMKGGIAEKEASIHVSNVMILTSDGTASRIGTRLEGDGSSAKRVRVAKKTGEVLANKT
ncbi:MAG: 50S ribosomal protein L24 [Acidobacteriaceae bacterium]|nr:50S ribosomal protein L24 [Acidobacteriaceae bacterium]